MREKQLFEYLKKNYLPDLELAKDRYSTWDCISRERSLLIELKSRSKHYDTLLIERKKFDGMAERALALGYSPLYVNSTPEGVFSFRILEIPLEWEVNHKNPSTTSFSNKARVEKEVAYIPVSLGTKI